MGTNRIMRSDAARPALRRGAALLFGAAVGLGAAAGLGGTAAEAQQGPPVDVATPLQAKVTDWDEFTGRFEAVERVELRARVSGYLEEIKFRDGDVVSKDDVLFVIDPRPFEAAYARAQAELQAAEAEQARASAELARGEQLVLNRTVAESTLDERRAVKLRADAEVAIAEAALRSAGLDLEFTQVSAPFDGRISDSKSDAGNLVTAGETLLATIVRLNPIHLVFTASEADYLKYARLDREGKRPGSRVSPNPVQARLLDEQGWPHQGAMNFVDNELDVNSGTITGRALFENDDFFLVPGLFARVRLIASGEYEALLLPDVAVLSDQARKIVMTVDEAGSVSAKPVRLGPLFRGMRVIREGLEATDVVVVNGVQRARPGGQVTPQPVELSFSEPAGAAAGGE